MQSTMGRKSVKASSSAKSNSGKGSVLPPPTVGEVAVFGQADRATLAEIDQVADQMLMPRSWVVSQILREWAEGRAAELAAIEQSWNGSYREEVGERGL